MPIKLLPIIKPVVLFNVTVLVAAAPPLANVLLAGVFVSCSVTVKFVEPTVKKSPTLTAP